MKNENRHVMSFAVLETPIQVVSRHWSNRGGRSIVWYSRCIKIALLGVRAITVPTGRYLTYAGTPMAISVVNQLRGFDSRVTEKVSATQIRATSPLEEE